MMPNFAEINTIYICLEEWRGEKWDLHPWGSRLAPGGEIKNLLRSEKRQQKYLKTD
jgi:hypothetical protein